jgi:hypothetical protein
MIWQHFAANDTVSGVAARVSVRYVLAYKLAWPRYGQPPGHMLLSWMIIGAEIRSRKF